jgi:hypothetical protein
LIDNRNKYPNGPDKLESQYTGPHIVSEVPSRNTLQVKINSKTKKNRSLFHINQVKKWIEPDPIFGQENNTFKEKEETRV